MEPRTVTFKSPTRPLCRCCGKPMPKATTNVHFVDYGVGLGGAVRVDVLPRTRQDVAALYPDREVVSIRRDQHGGVYSAWLWDGESWTDDLFCKVACAERFARIVASHHPEIQTQDYADARTAHPQETA